MSIDSKWHIAEFGVGKQGFCSLYAQKFEKVYGIDIEDYSSYHKNIEFILAKQNHIPMQDDCVDLVVSHSVLEHVENLNVSLSEINRILKPNGLLFLTVSPLYFSSFGAHIYRKGKRLENWEHLIRGTPEYMSYETPIESKERCATNLNGLTCKIFLENVGLQPWNIIYFERIYERKCIPENVDRTVATEIDLLTEGMLFFGQKIPLPTDFIPNQDSGSKDNDFSIQQASHSVLSEKKSQGLKKQLRNLLDQFHIYRAISSSGLFDREYYIKNNGDVARSSMDPLKHYIRHGGREGRNPNKYFDTKWYLNTYPDVAASGINPLYHYCEFGWREHRDPSIYFSTKLYLVAYPDLIDGKINPLAHWLKSEQSRNKNIFEWNYRISEAGLLRNVREYNSQKPKRKAKIVVYSAIIGNYDSLIIPEYITNDWDYVCFSDIDIPGKHIFKICKPDYYNADPARTVRYIKMHPHNYFNEYDYSIWIDSNILIRGPHLENSVRDCIDRGVLLMCNPHPHRNCVYDELQACIDLNKDDKNIMETQIEKYKKEGFPEKFGLFEGNIIIRKHNDEKVKAFDQAWWNEIENGSRRDQLSAMYVLWKQQLPFTTLPDMKDVRIHEGNDYCMFRHNEETHTDIPSYSQPDFMRK